MTEDIEKLLALKDEELTKVNKVKDMLKEQLMKTREENAALKEEIANLKTNTGAQTTSYPDLEAKIKSLEEKLSESDTQIKNLSQQNKTLTSELENAKKGAEKSSSDEKGSETESGQEGPIPVEKLLNQVKNGMFKLGQQNFSIEQKIDTILEQLQNVNVPTASVSAMPMHGTGGIALKGQSIASPSRVSQDDAAPIRKPSDLARVKDAKKEDNSNADEEVHVRKPSDRLRSIKSESESLKDQDAPVRRAGLSAPKVQLKEDQQDEPKKTEDTPVSKSGGISKTIRTIKHPEDGIIKCPDCGAQSFQEMENHAKIISFAPVKKYGKKYYCKICRIEWDYDYV